MRILVVFIIVMSWQCVRSQALDSTVVELKNKLEQISTYEAEVRLEVDVEFIKMPPKTAQISYQESEELAISSSDFLLLPKKGMDVSFVSLFRHPFITVDRGLEKGSGKILKKVSILPTTNKSDFVLATLVINTETLQIEEAEISTKKNGTYKLLLAFEQDTSVLPSKMEVLFEIDSLNIPLQYMGSGIEVDKEVLKSDSPKEGKIFLTFSNYKIAYK